MFRKWTARVAVALGVGFALIAGLTSPAYAANTTLDLYYLQVHSARMVHLDDGDDFRVWDFNDDGHGVRGTLYVEHSVTGVWSRVESVYNGKGMGEYVQFDYDVLEIKDYKMTVCLVDGSGDTTPVHCSSREFEE